MKNLIYKLKYMATIVACFAVCITSACSNSEDEPYGAFDPNDPAVKAVLGYWNNGSVWPDFLWDAQKQATWGGGGWGAGFEFKNDGTFGYYLVANTSMSSYYYLFFGKYRVVGNKIIRYNQKADYVDQYYPSHTYRNRTTPDSEYTYRVQISGSTESIILTDKDGDSNTYHRNTQLTPNW